MALPAVLVGWKADDSTRTVIAAALHRHARLAYAAEVVGAARSAAIAEADAVLSWNLPKEFSAEELTGFRRARFLQTVSAGVNQVPFAKLPAALTVASNAGAYAVPMAEHAVGLMLAAAKCILDRHNKLVRLEWDQHNPTRQLAGATCAILGFGGIGRRIARIARSLDMRVMALNRSGRAEEPLDFIGTLDDLESVLRTADVVMLTIALNRATRGLLNARTLGWMKDDAILVNVARGDIIVEADLYAHLRAHPAFTACIDAWWVEPFHAGVFRVDTPLLELPNLLGSPHNSAQVPGILLDGAKRAAENVGRFLRGEVPENLVNEGDKLS
ncbi:MAG: hydroxyacid dehydrogenase [Alphaproteobacteria bacterium]|nr:hydroxyacid dehydrogenase [Alphaproteobacteria bacterium]